MNKMIPIPSKETSIKYNKKMVENITKEFYKEYMKLQNKETTFEKYWRIANEIIGTIDIQRNVKNQNNLNKFIDKITNKYIQKEIIRYLLDHCEETEFEIEIEKRIPKKKQKREKVQENQ